MIRFIGRLLRTTPICWLGYDDLCGINNKMKRDVNKLRNRDCVSHTQKGWGDW